MKKIHTLLPLLCSAAILQAYAAESAPRIEPVMSVRHSDSTPAAWYAVGRYQQEQKRLDLAADAYGQMLAKEPENTDARNALATVHASQNRLDDAIAEFEAVLKEHPELAYVRNNLGYAYFLKQNYRSAVSELGRAIALEPENARAFGNLVMAYEKLKTASAAAPVVAAAAVPAAPQKKAETPAASTPAAPAAEQAAAPAPQAAAQEAKPIRIEIANGTRDEQLGQGMADALRQNGVEVTEVTPLKPYTQKRTVILYRDGFREQALALSRKFATPPAMVNNTRTRPSSDRSEVRLVLGSSAAQAAAVPAADAPAAN